MHNWADELENAGGKINPDGTVDLYHATTKEKAAQILRDGVLKRPADAPDSYGVYFSSSPEAANDYGDGTLVKVKVNAADLHPDDSFPGKRLDFTAATKNGVYKPVSVSAVAPEAKSPVTKPGFNEWFGKSKIVDDQGQPKRVYHGTRASADFNEFSTEGRPMVENEHHEGEYTNSGSGADPTSYMGAHFAEQRETANKFASGKTDWMRSRYETGEEKPRVILAYLKIENPKDFGPERNFRDFIYQGKLGGYAGDELLNRAMEADGVEAPWDGGEDVDKWMHKYESDTDFRAEQHKWLFERYHPEEGEEDLLHEAAQDLAGDAKSRLEKMGHDGIRYKNEVEGGKSIVAFDSKQVRNALAEEGPYRSTERRVSARSAPLSATELQAAIKNRKAVQTPFDQTQGAMYTIKRDSALRKLDAIHEPLSGEKAPAEPGYGKRNTLVR